MPSLIAGYEYDIFISYRQKDNKGDHWVTEFVSALKSELDATFKEDISIYFDENPHDGLLETHNVDKSLEGKLKCLIFIPIISQTYCDPKSFAWQNELCEFNVMAQDDQFGMDIVLQNGNVASRILPIKIYDIDPSDKRAFEREIGDALRSIDFIFKTPGVNRPLRSHEDHPHDNQNKTYYRDQINKVAYAIKELIQGMKNPVNQSDDETEDIATTERSKLGRRILIVTQVFIAIAFAYFVYQKVREFKTPKVAEEATNSIAVLPLKNLSSTDDQYFSDGLTDDIIDRLAKIKSLLVISRTSIDHYKNTTKTIPEIARELNVPYILEGSVRRQSEKVKVVIQLVDAKTDIHLWSETIERNAGDVFSIQKEIAEKVARFLQLSLSVNEQGELAKAPTTSMEAYDLYLRAEALRAKGDFRSNEIAIRNCKQAVILDPQFAEAFVSMADGLFLRHLFHSNDEKNLDSAQVIAQKVLKLKPTLAKSYATIGRVYQQRGDLKMAKQWFHKSNQIQRGSASNPLSWLMRIHEHRLDSALYFSNEALKYQPEMNGMLRHGEVYLELGLLDSAMKYFEKAHFANPDHPSPKRRIATVFTAKKQYDRAIGLLKDLVRVDDSVELRRVLTYDYVGKKDWIGLKSFVKLNNMEDDLPMAYLLILEGDNQRAKKIIDSKKEEFKRKNSPIGMAITLVIENDLSTAIRCLDQGYANFQVRYSDIIRIPYFLELEGIKEFDALTSRMKEDNKVALENIKKMKF